MHGLPDEVVYAGSVPPAAQLPAILGMYPKRRRKGRGHGRFRMFPEELSGPRLFNPDGWSAVALGQC